MIRNNIHLLTAILSIITFVCSCSNELSVTDYSFDFSGMVNYDQEADQHRLTLTCNKKAGDGYYNIAFTIDDENIITLTDMQGTTHQDSFTESFSDTDTHTYILAENSVGIHQIKLTISTDNFSQSLALTYEVTKQKYEIHSEVTTMGAECSTLLMSLADGDAKYIYTISVKLGEDELTVREIDFSTTPIHAVDLPGTIRPGSHSVALDVSDGMTPKHYVVDFQEPIRHPEVSVILKHDESSGYHVATIGNNPYGIIIDFTVYLELKGKSSYYHEEEDFWWKKPDYSYITEKDERTQSESGSNCSINMTDRDGIANKITSQWETSYIWSSISTPGGGEDSGSDYTYISGSQASFYQIYYEALTIDITGEEVSGVTLKITNNLGKMTLNGKESTSGTINIPL